MQDLSADIEKFVSEYVRQQKKKHDIELSGTRGAPHIAHFLEQARQDADLTDDVQFLAGLPEGTSRELVDSIPKPHSSLDDLPGPLGDDSGTGSSGTQDGDVKKTDETTRWIRSVKTVLEEWQGEAGRVFDRWLDAIPTILYNQDAVIRAMRTLIKAHEETVEAAKSDVRNAIRMGTSYLGVDIDYATDFVISQSSLVSGELGEIGKYLGAGLNATSSVTKALKKTEDTMEATVNIDTNKPVSDNAVVGQAQANIRKIKEAYEARIGEIENSIKEINRAHSFNDPLARYDVRQLIPTSIELTDYASPNLPPSRAERRTPGYPSRTPGPTPTTEEIPDMTPTPDSKSPHSDR